MSGCCFGDQQFCFVSSLDPRLSLVPQASSQNGSINANFNTSVRFWLFLAVGAKKMEFPILL